MDSDRVPTRPTSWTTPSAAPLSIEYDLPSDILYLDACPAYEEQDSDDTEDDVIFYWNPETGAIERVMIMSFSHRTPREIASAAWPFIGDLRQAIIGLLPLAKAA